MSVQFNMYVVDKCFIQKLCFLVLHTFWDYLAPGHFLSTDYNKGSNFAWPGSYVHIQSTIYFESMVIAKYLIKIILSLLSCRAIKPTHSCTQYTLWTTTWSIFQFICLIGKVSAPWMVNVIIVAYFTDSQPQYIHQTVLLTSNENIKDSRVICES